MMDKEKEMMRILGILMIAGVMIMIFSYVLNIIKFFDCDFSGPYKCEVTRGVGIIVPPVGVITGFMDFEDR